MMNRIEKRLFERVDGSTLGVVRALFGGVMVLETIRYLLYGRVWGFFILPIYHFKYWGFEWVKVWPGDTMYLLFGLMGAGAVGLMTGFCTRLSAPLFLLSYTYIHLIEAAEYNNHYYLIVLLAFLFWITPCESAFSLDARRRKRLALKAGKSPPPETVPRWSIYIFRFQMAAVYIFAALAKWTPDWIIHGEPMRTWLSYKADKIPLAADLLRTDAAGWFFVYSGMFFDLLVVPLLFWKRTRWLAVLLAFIFHGTNKLLFDIGIFPVMAFSTIFIFFEPDWARNALQWIEGKVSRAPLDQTPKADTMPLPRAALRLGIMLLLAVYAAIQLFLPLRHFLYPGNPSWTEEGHRYAWRMKLRDKHSELIYIKVSDPTTRKVEQIDVGKYLYRHQAEALYHPFMLAQFAKHLAQEYREKRGWENPQVRAKLLVGLNDRPLQFIVDPWTDLAAVSLSPFKRADWIIPLAPRPDETHESPS